MYDIYIQHFNDENGNVVTSEQLLYSIPITDDQNVLKDPVVKTEMGKTGSFEFSLYPMHPYFNAWNQMKTIMRVVYDGDTIFRGRALTIDNNRITGERKLHFEGDLAFLMDSYQPATKEVDRSEITVKNYIIQILTNHNVQMAEDQSSEAAIQLGLSKQIQLGEVPGNYSAAIDSSQRIVVDKAEKFGSNSFETSMTALEALTKEYGGYFRTRYYNGLCFLDWLDYCFRYEVNGQPIEIGENLIDISDSVEVDNIFTALVPIGSKDGEEIFIHDYRPDIHGYNNRILVPQIVSLFSENNYAELRKGYHAKEDYENAIKDYGMIYKTQQFQNADTAEKLGEYAVDWIKNNYAGGITSFSLTAIDMHHIDETVSKYLTGDRVTVIYPDIAHSANGVTPKIQKTLTLTSTVYNLHSPQSNQYNLGIPNSILSKTYGSKGVAVNKANGSGSGAAAAMGAAGGGHASDSDFHQRQLEQEAANHIVSASFNSDEWQAIQEQDPTRAASIIRSSEIHLVTYISGLDEDTEIKTKDGKTVTVPKEFRGSVTSMALDAGRSVLKFFDPAIKLLDGTTIGGSVVDYDSYYDREVSAGLVIDGFNRSLSIRDIPNWRQAASDFISAAVDPFVSIGETFGIIHRPSSSGGKGGSSRIESSVPLIDESGDTIGRIITSSTDGNTGIQSAMGSILGKDGSGTLGTIIADGLGGLFSFFNPSTVDGSQTPVETAQTDGSSGSMSLGATGDLDGWTITLNKPLTYTAGGNTYTVSAGSVAANDMHFTQTYDSVRAELAVFDQMYADYAQIGTLVALKADINWLATHYVSADSLNAGFTITGGISSGSITSSGTVSASGAVSGSDIVLTGAHYGSLSEAYKDVRKEESDGTVTLYFKTFTGAEESVTFSKPEEVRVQSSRNAGTYRSEGYKTVTPNAGYDAMAEVTFRISISSGGGGGTCFATGSLVRLADGSELPIEKLTLGSILAAYDSEHDQFCETEIVAIRQYKHADDVFEIKMTNGKSLLVTDSHPLYTREGWKAIDPEKVKEEGHHHIEATILKETDELLGIDGYVRIEAIRYRDDLRDCTVYNIDVEDIDTYIVDGIVAHNADDKPQ